MRKLFAVGVGFVLLLLCVVSGMPVGAAPSTVFVRTDGSDTLCNGTADASAAATPTCAFQTIGKGVSSVASGGTVKVGAGQFTEQVSVAQNLTLTGAGAASTTIKAPATLVNDASGNNVIVEFNGGITNSMSGFTLTGPGTGSLLDAGILVTGSANLTLSATTITAIRDEPLGGGQHGEGIRVGTPHGASASTGTLTATGITVTDYQKNGITVSGAGTTASVTDSTVTGAGPTPKIAQNGIQVSSGATATLDHNAVSGHAYTGSGASSTGILLFNADASVVVKNNTVSSNDLGIYIQAGAGATVNNNTISTNGIGIYHFSPANGGNVIAKAGSGKHKTPSVLDASKASPVRSVGSGAPTQITGNIVQNNTTENIYLDEGTATLTGNTIDGSQIGVHVVAFSGNTDGTDGNSQGVLTNNEIKNATVAGIKLEDTDLTDAFIPKINGHSNKITTTTGVNNTTGTTIDLTKNWWGNQSGPTNATNVGGTGASVSSNVTFSPWCGDAACTIFYGIPTKLVFTTQPGNATALAPFGTQPVVKAEDATGDLGINFTGQVTLGIGTNPPGNGALSGGQVNAVAGVATFTNAAIDKPSTGYTLTAAAIGLTGDTSAPFNVAPPTPTIGAITPATGGTAGGEVVTITGTNFFAGDTVTFGGVAASATINSSTKITVIAPAHTAGKVDVRVANTNAQGNTLTNGYEYDAPGSTTTGRPGPVNAQAGTPESAPPGRSPVNPNPNPHP